MAGQASFKPLDVLLIEPYFGGSHKAWAEGLVSWSDHSIQTLTMLPRFWKWRMRGAALRAARQIGDTLKIPDVLIASDMFDLAGFLGLARREVSEIPIVLYMHENQWTYPQQVLDSNWPDSRRRRAERRDKHYPFLNLTSMLAADEIWWNSRHNLDAALNAIPGFMRSFPDMYEVIDIERLQRKSMVIAPGVDLKDAIGRAGATSREPGPARILWNHRWEYDKRPSTFFAALDEMLARGLEFELVLLGERFGEMPAGVEEAIEGHSDRICVSGHLDSREDYWQAVRSSDIIISTAVHEFFGISIVEGVGSGCWPLVPNALSYPEVLPEAAHAACLYSSFEDLVEKLALAIETVAKGTGERDTKDAEVLESLRIKMQGYDWPTCIHAYNDGITSLYDRIANKA